MANLNTRQINFLTNLKAFAQCVENLYGQAYLLVEAYNEEFASGQDHDLANADNLDSVYNHTAPCIEAAVNGSIKNFLNYYTGEAVDTVEYGKDLRRIK